MGLFDFLKPKTEGWQLRGSYINTHKSEAELKQLIHAVIVALQFNLRPEGTEAIDQIKERCKDDDLAMALYRLVPTAYCRLFIPEPHYSDDYIVAEDGQAQKQFSFSKDSLYQLVLDQCKTSIRFAGSSEAILSVVSHSAEFNAINEALNAGADLKNLVCAPVYFT